MNNALVRVTHVGPVGPEPGGISAVLRNYSEWRWERTRIVVRRSWAPNARLHSLGPFLSAAAFIMLSPRRTIGVVHVHLSQRGSFLREGAVVLLAALRRLPICCTIHGSEFEPFMEQRPRLTMHLLRRCRRVFVLSRHLERRLSKVLGEQRVRYLPNAVAIPHSISTTPQDCSPLAVFAGEVSQRKGVDTLLAAWVEVVREVPDAELHVLGPQHPTVSPQAVSGVRFAGPAAHDEVLAALERCRVAVLPSRAEGMPMFLLEAMSRGRPVVSTTVGAIPDLVTAGTGVLVPPEDVPALRDALTLYLSDGRRAAHDGNAARAHVTRAHSVKAVRQLLEREWAECARAPHAFDRSG